MCHKMFYERVKTYIWETVLSSTNEIDLFVFLHCSLSDLLCRRSCRFFLALVQRVGGAALHLRDRGGSDIFMMMYLYIIYKIYIYTSQLLRLRALTSALACWPVI